MTTISFILIKISQNICLWVTLIKVSIYLIILLENQVFTPDLLVGKLG